MQAILVRQFGDPAVLKLEDLSGSFFDKGLDRVLIGEEVSAEDRVLGVEIQVVVFSQDRGGAALG